MMLYASSCERPSKSSASVFLPSSVSNSYSFSTGTQGRSSRFLLISWFRSACSASSFASSSRAACHSSRVPILCSGISFPSCRAGPLPSDRTARRTLLRHEMRPRAPRKLIAVCAGGRALPTPEPQAATGSALTRSWVRLAKGTGRRRSPSFRGAVRQPPLSDHRTEAGVEPEPHTLHLLLLRHGKGQAAPGVAAGPNRRVAREIATAGAARQEHGALDPSVAQKD